ncbi:MAG: alpha/beta hydrolase [Ferruginibacter sp.]
MKLLRKENLIEPTFEMTLHKFIFLVLLISNSLFSCDQNKEPQQVKKILPAVAHEQMIIWTKSIPDTGLITASETYHDGMVRNVSNPTITIYPPKGINTGVAAVVFPGGGYKALAIELEGSEICEWLASIGVTGILLKYRVPNTGPHYDHDCDCQKDPEKPLALQDAQRTVGLVRFRSKEWNIDPHKIGVLGFSAGGHLVADVSTNYKKRAYPIMDEADKISCRPDFGMVLYPGHMTFHTTKSYELNRAIPVDSNTPPMFILQAGNDPIDSIQNSLVYYIALKKAGVLAEYHIYAEGGHAFGLNKTSQPIADWSKLPIAGWPKLAETWLHTIKMIVN